MTYKNLIHALNATGIPFREGGWVDAAKLRTDYGVYALDGAVDMMANNKHSERFQSGTVDLFALIDDGAVNAARIEEALEASGCIWRYESRQYEQDTHITHHEWVFYVLP